MVTVVAQVWSRRPVALAIARVDFGDGGGVAAIPPGAAVPARPGRRASLTPLRRPTVTRDLGRT
jgi:hypothetical protein